MGVEKKSIEIGKPSYLAVVKSLKTKFLTKCLVFSKRNGNFLVFGPYKIIASN